MTGQDPKGQQPEAFKSLEAAAESGSRKPDDQGLEAKGDTAPEAGSLPKEQEEAARILRAGVGRVPHPESDPKKTS